MTKTQEQARALTEADAGGRLAGVLTSTLGTRQPVVRTLLGDQRLSQNPVLTLPSCVLGKAVAVSPQPASPLIKWRE